MSARARLLLALLCVGRTQQVRESGDPRAAPSDFSASDRALAIFDVDGTLLVTAGRELATHSSGERVAVHPLMEGALEELDGGGGGNATRSVPPPPWVDRSYAHAGEEDVHGDPYRLIERSCVLGPRVAALRAALADGRTSVAVLSARAHDPAWLAAQLRAKLRLPAPLDPALVQTVFSAPFEARLPRRADGGAWGTAARKAYALGELLRAVRPARAAFYDDVGANLEAAAAHAAAEFPAVAFEAHLVGFDESVAACAAEGIDLRERLHFQPRDAPAPGPLVARLLDTPLGRQRIGAFERAPSLGDLPLPP